MRSRTLALGVMVCVAALPLLLAAPAAAQTPTPTPTPPACPASQSWVTNPNPPQEIPGGGTDFCQFYQFAWQWFLWLVSPSSNGTDRNFEVQANFPLLQASGTDSCKATSNTPVLFVRTLKSADPNQPFIVPENIGQAGTNGAVIYDKNGNIVFYEVRFSRNLCPAPPTSGNLPTGTTEIKTAWRQIDPADAAGYYTNQAIIEGVSKTPVTLGLIGFHFMRTTAQHPEGVWMTWEHEANDPDCLQPQPTPPGGWSFTNAQCAQCLATSKTGTAGCTSCGFNTAVMSTKITGTASQICRVYRDGSGPNDNKVTENIPVVDGLNAQLVGPGGFLTTLPASSPLAVFANYPNIGGIWVSDVTMPATSANQRGSLQLANSVMETTFQGDFTGSGTTRTAATNCFGCHGYTPGSTATTGLSHIVDDIAGTPGTATAGGGGSAAAGGGSGGVEPVASHRPHGGG